MNNGASAKQLLEWQRSLDRSWGAVRFGALRYETKAGQHRFELEVYPDGLDAEAARVDLYAEGVNGGKATQQQMLCADSAPDSSGCRSIGPA